MPLNSKSLSSRARIHIPDWYSAGGQHQFIKHILLGSPFDDGLRMLIHIFFYRYNYIIYGKRFSFIVTISLVKGASFDFSFCS